MLGSVVVKFGSISARKFKFSRVKVCVVVVYGPTEGDEEREMFWNNLTWTK